MCSYTLPRPSRLTPNKGWFIKDAVHPNFAFILFISRAVVHLRCIPHARQTYDHDRGTCIARTPFPMRVQSASHIILFDPTLFFLVIVELTSTSHCVQRVQINNLHLWERENIKINKFLFETFGLANMIKLLNELDSTQLFIIFNSILCL